MKELPLLKSITFRDDVDKKSAERLQAFGFEKASEMTFPLILKGSGESRPAITYIKTKTPTDIPVLYYSAPPPRNLILGMNCLSYICFSFFR